MTIKNIAKRVVIGLGLFLFLFMLVSFYSLSSLEQTNQKISLFFFATIYLIISIFIVTSLSKILSKYKSVERKQAKSEIKYRTLIENSPNMIMIIERGNIKYVNPAGLLIFGMNDVEDIMNKKLKEFIHPNDYDKVNKVFNSASAEEGTNDLIELDITKSGESSVIYAKENGKNRYEFYSKELTECNNRNHLVGIH